MNTAQLIKAAPLLSLVAFLAYSSYSMHASLPGTAAEDAALAKGLDILVQDLYESGSAAATKLGQEVRDPFQAIVSKAAAVEVAKSQDLPPPQQTADPLAEIVQGLSLDATFIQGRDQIAIIDGRIYSRGQRLKVNRDDGMSPSPLLVASVFPTKVVLQGGGKTYVLGYSDQLANRKDDAPRGEAPMAQEATAAELDPAGQLAMFQRLLNSPLGALGKSMIGNALPTDPSRAASGPQSSRSRGGRTTARTRSGDP